MNNTVRLARVIFKGNGLANFSSDTGRRRKKLSRIGSIILFLLLAGYMIAITTGASLFFYDALAPIGLQSLIVSLFLSIGAMLAFFFGVLYVISIFYYASDVEKLLPLPLKADEIIGAKLLVTAAYEYIYLVVLVTPPLVVYGVRSSAGPQYYIYALIALVILPIVPICLASLISMVIMRFTRFARNKDRFSLFSGLLAMVVAFAVIYGSQSMMSLPSGDLADLISQSAGDLARITTMAFPGTALAAAALAESIGLLAVGQIALAVLIATTFLAVTMGLSKLLYFQGVIGLNTSGSVRRKMERAELAKATGSGSAFAAYMLKDVRILVRTPIFFMNNVILNFIWPVFFLVPFFQTRQDADIAEFFELIRSSLTPESPGVPLALAVVFAVACFISGTNGVASSALSREGKLFYFVKILPMSYNRQIWAKLTVGILLSLIGTLLLILMLVILVSPPFWFVSLLLAAMPGAILLTNLPGMLFELLWPKLKWDNEQKAVKQNLNVLYGILTGVLLAALAIVPVAIFDLKLVSALLLICVLPLVLSLGLALLIRRIGPRLILSLDV